jgi:hypothetical protein
MSEQYPHLGPGYYQTDQSTIEEKQKQQLRRVNMVHLMKWAAASQKITAVGEPSTSNRDDVHQTKLEENAILTSSPRFDSSVHSPSKAHLLKAYSSTNNCGNVETTLLKKIARRIHSQLSNTVVDRSSSFNKDPELGPGSYEADQDTISRKQQKIFQRKQQSLLRNPYLNKVYPYRDIESRPPLLIPQNTDEGYLRENQFMAELKARVRGSTSAGPSIQIIKQVDEKGRNISRVQNNRSQDLKNTHRSFHRQEAKLIQIGKLYEKMRLRDSVARGRLSPTTEYQVKPQPNPQLAYVN